MQPATPAAASRATSSLVATPPEATTGSVDGRLHLGHRREVRPGQHAVGGDVGVNDRRDRLAGKLPRQRRPPPPCWSPASRRWPRGPRGRRSPSTSRPGNFRHICRNQSGWRSPACRSPAASAPGRAVRGSSLRCGCRRPVRSRRRPTRQWRGRRRGFPAGRRGRRPDRPGGGARPPARPNAEPWRRDPRRRRSPAGSRPAAGGRTSPAQVNRRPDFHPILAPVRTPGNKPKHVI